MADIKFPPLPHGRLLNVWICEYCRSTASSFTADTWIPNIQCHCQNHPYGGGFINIMTPLILEFELDEMMNSQEQLKRKKAIHIKEETK